MQNSAKWRWLFVYLTIVSLMPLATSCQTLRLPHQSKEVTLQMQVSPGDQPSRYTVSGTTNLPDNTPITVAAIRYLNGANREAAAGSVPASQSSFTVLDYISTRVSQGKWQAELTLQQQGIDGKQWEAWQMQQPRLGLTLQPDQTVSFVATLESMDQLLPLEQQLAEKGFRLPRGMVRSTAEGQRYAEVVQTIDLAAPNPNDQPPAALEPHNYGWGDRYVLLKEPPNPTRLERPTEPQTNAPPSPEEFLR